MSAETNSSATYDVVQNDEGQYSIWATTMAMPAGWRAVGHSGTKEACLAYIKEVWVDMRPRSLTERSSSSASA